MNTHQLGHSICQILAGGRKSASAHNCTAISGECIWLSGVSNSEYFEQRKTLTSKNTSPTSSSLFEKSGSAGSLERYRTVQCLNSAPIETIRYTPDCDCRPLSKNQYQYPSSSRVGAEYYKQDVQLKWKECQCIDRQSPLHSPCLQGTCPRASAYPGSY